MRRIGIAWLFFAASLAAANGPRVAAQSFLNLPIRFEPDQGRFHARAPGQALTVAGDGTAVEFRGALVRMHLVGASRAATLTGEEPLSGVSHYLLGNNPDKWRRNVPGFARVRARQVYPGIDLVYYGTGRQIEYDFVVAPGADPGAIAMSFEGARSLRLDASGDLILDTEAGTFRHHKPVLNQGQGAFVIEDGQRVKFRVANYDARRELVIDPVLSFSSYLGGSFEDCIMDTAMDASGYVYVAGITGSSDFPVSSSAYQKTFAANRTPFGRAWSDAFILKLSADLKTVVYSTFLGGSGPDGAFGIAVDKSGAPAIVGVSSSVDYPTTASAYQIALQSYTDYVVTKLSADGKSLIYSTYFGGSSTQFESTFEGAAIAQSGSGAIYICGSTYNADFPVTANAVQKTFGGGESISVSDAFVTKFDTNGIGTGSLIYSTFLGGSGSDAALAIVVDASGNAYVRGGTTSTDFPVTAKAFQSSMKGSGDAFLTVLNATGSSITYSTYLGGSGGQYGTLSGASKGPLSSQSIMDVVAVYSSDFGGSAYGSGLALDADGYVYITGATDAYDFPTTSDAVQPTRAGSLDAFLVKLDITKTGSAQLLYGTYLGGTGQDRATGVAVDSSGVIYVRGETLSTDFPVTSDALQTKSAGSWDGFLTLIAPGSSTIVHSTYLGGSGDDLSLAKLLLDGQTGVYLVGFTKSTDYPVTTNALHTSNSGLWDGFLTRLEVPIPVISSAGIGNAASYATGKVSPGEILVIYGQNLSASTLTPLQLTVDGLVSTELAETKVSFDGVAAPLIYVSATQISAVVPYAVASRASTQIQVQYKKTGSNVVTLPVVASVPALFTVNQAGTGQGAILNQNYSVNSSTNPIPRGQIAMLWGTGEGATTPTGVDGLLGAAPLPAPVLASSVQVLIGGVNAAVQYVGGAPGMVAGLFQLNVKIPESLPAGTVEVIVTIGTASSPSGVTIAIQ